MGVMWLIWDGGGAAARVREEVRLRCPDARIVCVDDADALVELARGLGDGVRIALGASPGNASGLLHVISAVRGGSAGHAAPAVLACIDGMDAGLVSELFDAGAQEVIATGASLTVSAVRGGSAGHAAPAVLACIDGMDAGLVSELFDAGAQEVIATGASLTGSADARGQDAEAAHMDIGTEVATRGTVASERDGLVPDDPFAPMGYGGDEVPPWSTGTWDALDEPDGDAVACIGDVAEQTGDIVDLGDVVRRVREREVADHGGPRAPVIAVVSGQGGAGKTTLVAAMAACAARAGLRAAVIDVDLMFGDLPSVLGVDTFRGLEGIDTHAMDGELAEEDIESCAMRVGPGLTLWGPLIEPERAELSFRGLEGIDTHAMDGELAEEDIESCAMRVGPGLTLWGPLIEPERAELYGAPVERLIIVLRKVADVIFIDTSTHWGDAVAAAVALCDRCLVVGGAGANAGASAARVVGLATRLGVPATRMTSVFNRLGSPGCAEEDALRFEMGASLASRARISFGGEEVAGLIGFGRLDSLVAGEGPFSRDVRDLTARVLTELGCSFDERLMGPAPDDYEQRPRFRLPWRRKAGEHR